MTSFQAAGAWTVAISLVAAPAPGESATPTSTEESAPSTAADPTAGQGTLTLYGGAQGGLLAVHGPTGEQVASVALKPGQTVEIALPPGLYDIRPEGPGVNGAPVRLSAGQSARFELPGRPPPPPRVAAEPGDGENLAAALKNPPPDPAKPERPAWKRPVAPIMSAITPGTGQFINGELGKGFGMLLGTAALLAGSVVLYTAPDPLEGAGVGGNSQSFGTAAVTAAGFGVLTGGLQLLYASQIMDAYAVAADKPVPTPRKRHRLALEVGRSATVGFRVGDPAAAFYPDWSVALLVQIVPRFSFGLSDLSMKFGSDVGRVTMQAGARMQYRFYDRGRVWMSAALGSILQGSVGRGGPDSLVLGAPPPPTETSFAAVPYGQLDLRYFIVDRWSLNLVPRVSVPLGTRFYGGDRAIPKHAVTFELGTGVGVYF